MLDFLGSVSQHGLAHVVSSPLQFLDCLNLQTSIIMPLVVVSGVSPNPHHLSLLGSVTKQQRALFSVAVILIIWRIAAKFFNSAPREIQVMHPDKSSAKQLPYNRRSRRRRNSRRRKLLLVHFSSRSKVQPNIQLDFPRLYLRQHSK